MVVTGRVPFRNPLALMLLQLLGLFPVPHPIQTAGRKPPAPKKKKKKDKEKEHLSNTTGKAGGELQVSLLKLLQVPGQRLFLPSSWKGVSR